MKAFMLTQDQEISLYWPDQKLGMYAPGNYYCKCHDCGVEYIGDKRSIQCYPCALNDSKIISDNIQGDGI